MKKSTPSQLNSTYIDAIIRLFDASFLNIFLAKNAYLPNTPPHTRKIRICTRFCFFISKNKYIYYSNFITKRNPYDG
ncbi:hypothetical protein EGI24_07010 [Lacihabitans sp. CS3-21]|nr:hypothetical protein [Lacihabitans sp. CS3-21]